MDEGNHFFEMIHRVRAGDPGAAAELVRCYEPAVRRVVRLQLRDPRLRRVLDSLDVCQAVLASFFVRAAAGQFDLEQPGQLLRLLIAMARNKLATWARSSYVLRRETCPDRGGGSALARAAPGPGPCQQAASRELLRAVLDRLSAEERQLADRRAAGLEWARIADELGGSAEALRKKLGRALNRVSQQLGLDELNHG
jgi:RNA polymerase sigma-70 factor (ECF subfamily)